MTEELKIKFAFDTERDDFESISKGYRTDVFVIHKDNWYQISAYTLIRLQQDFEMEIKEYGFYTPDANLILVEEASVEHIRFTLNKLHEQDTFKQFIPATPEQFQLFFNNPKESIL